MSEGRLVPYSCKYFLFRNGQDFPKRIDKRTLRVPFLLDITPIKIAHRYRVIVVACNKEPIKQKTTVFTVAYFVAERVIFSHRVSP